MKDIGREVERRAARAAYVLASVAPLPERVHEARRELKKARAALKLAKGRMRGPAYRRERALLRAAGRKLSPLRDAEVLPATLRALETACRAAGEGAVLERSIGRAETRAKRLERTAAADSPLWPEIDSLLRRAHENAAHLPKLRRGRFEKRLERSGRRLGRRWRRAARSGREADFHASRKAAKDLRYQLALEKNAPRGRLKRLHALTDRLGEAHDLALAQPRLPPALKPAARRRVRALRAAAAADARRLGLG